MRERARVLDVRDRKLQLLREIRDLLDDLAERALDVAGQGLEFRALLDHVGDFLHVRDQIRVGGDETLEPDSLRALDQNPDRAVRHLEHPGHHACHADPLDVVGPRLLELGVLGGDHDEAAIAGEDVVDQPHRALLADGERRQRPRVGDHVPEGQDRQGLGKLAAVGDRVLDLLRRDDLDRRAALGQVVVEFDRGQDASSPGLNRRADRSARGAPWPPAARSAARP